MASRSDFIQLFRAADKNNNGNLTLTELFAELKKLGYKGSNQEFIKYFFEEDKSMDYRLNLEEFISSMSRAPPDVHRVAMLRTLFSRFDKDGNGTLNKKELQNAKTILSSKLSTMEVDLLMLIMDKDGSETIDMEEFIEAFLNMKQ